MDKINQKYTAEISYYTKSLDKKIDILFEEEIIDEIKQIADISEIRYLNREYKFFINNNFIIQITYKGPESGYTITMKIINESDNIDSKRNKEMLNKIFNKMKQIIEPDNT